jgi:carbonic anhydrase
MPKNQLRKAVSAKRAQQSPSPVISVNANLNTPQGFTPEEAAVMAEPHSPQCFLVCCIDSRFQPAKALDYGPGIALEYRQIAAAVPPEDSASADFLSRMAFRRLNDIDHIIMVAHSDCGGAQAALKVPEPDLDAGGDLHEVAAVAHRSGLDIAALGKKLLAEEAGDIRAAGDRLSREIAVKARENLMGYKGRDGFATIGDEVKAGKLKVLLLYYDLAARAFELYDPKKSAWKQNVSTCDMMARTAPVLHNCAAHNHAAPKAAGARK